MKKIKFKREYLPEGYNLNVMELTDTDYWFWEFPKIRFGQGVTMEYFYSNKFMFDVVE